ncbi:MAG: hypothetical protein M3124_09255, partial [Actinomycetota bacterium]|nr:hypothetical protein [Actinomycetota bacterium]
GGPLLAASSYFMKSPPVQYSDAEARDLVEDFIFADQPSPAREADLLVDDDRLNTNGTGNGHKESVDLNQVFGPRH